MWALLVDDEAHRIFATLRFAVAEKFDWDDAAVDTLKDLWRRGFSASKIAWQLGYPVTRSAVLGKIHRLGLTERLKLPPAGRPKRSQRPHTERTIRLIRRAQTAATSKYGIGSSEKVRASVGPKPVTVAKSAQAPSPTPAVKARAKKPAPIEDGIEYAPIPDSLDDQDIPIAQRKTLFELTAETCRFPVGQPGEGSFFFCGAPPARGLPYCAPHSDRCFNSQTRRTMNLSDAERERRRNQSRENYRNRQPPQFGI